MPRAARCSVLVAISGLLLTACSHHAGRAAGATGYAAPPAASAPAGGSGAPLPIGPGPQPAYTVQRQPPAGSCHYRYEQGQPLPDPACTPGALNPKVGQATVDSTICRRGGYTSDIRPPASITGREKRANAQSYGYTRSLYDAEYDHLVSLELGGDPNDPRNLWVEPPSPDHRPGAGPNNDKDKVESVLHSAVCNGRVTLAAAQRAIASDWTTAEAALGLTRS